MKIIGIFLVLSSLILSQFTFASYPDGESSKASQKIYKKLVENHKQGKSKYATSASREDILLLSRGEIPENLQPEKTKRLITKEAAPQLLKYPSNPAAEPHTWEYINLFVVDGTRTTDIRSDFATGGAREADHTTQFAILDLDHYIDARSYALASVTMKGTGQRVDLSHTIDFFSEESMWRVSLRNSTVQQVYTDQPITPGWGVELKLTIHTNEFGYTYVELKQNNVIKYAALGTFDYSPSYNNSNGIELTLEETRIGGPDLFSYENGVNFRLDGDLGWFEHL